MKTKTDSFTKFITFCVLALFLFTNMILFSSCDNGNSPNDNTNEEQNNNVPTDYCEICDGVQTENCGIEHKCNDENCVEYADKKIYKNGHTHDYCERTDCDGSTHMGADHPTGPTYSDWFKKITIGGEGSPYEVPCIDSIKYNEANPYTTEVERYNNYQNQYKSFIEGLEFSDEFIKQFPEIKNINFAEFAEYNINDKISYKENFDQLIGSTTDSKNGSINDACKSAIETITKNIGITSNNPEDMELDNFMFYLYYRAMANEVYNYANSGTATYTSKKETIQQYLFYVNDATGNDYKIYQEDGTIHQEALQRFDDMINAAVTKLNGQGKQATITDLRNIINLSFTASSIEGLHDYLSFAIHKHTDECNNNEMVDVIGDVEVDEMNPIAQAKLNKSIFSQNYGRELC